MNANSRANLRYKASNFVVLLFVACQASLSGTRAHGQLVTWTGSTDDDWSTVGNWNPSALPGSTNIVRFTTGDSPGINYVDIDFTIAELQYIENGTHTTYINPSANLTISDDLSIGRETGTSMSSIADGSLYLTNNSSLNVGTATAPAVVNIGMYEYSNTSSGTPGTATGLLDATLGTANLYLSDLYVGHGIDLWGGTTAKGTLETGQNTTITTTSAYVGTGTSATGIVNMNGGLLTIGNDLWIGHKTWSGSDATDGNLTLGSGSTLHVGTTTSPAFVNIGINQTGSGDATGVLDATQGTAYLYLTELNVGRKSSSGGTATGTLKWNQSVALHADEVYFGRGKGTGKLYVPTGGTFLLGTATDPVSRLAISYNDTTGVGASNADLDFTVTDPTFEAYIGGDLSIGRVAGWSMSTTANGSLTLGGNSTLNVGTATAPAVVNIGMYEYFNVGSGIPGNATGLLDATQGKADFHLSELNVGYGESLWGGTTATGTLRWNQSNPLFAQNVYFGRGGSSTGILEVPATGTFKLGSATDPVSLLGISYNDSDGEGTSNAHLDFTVTDPVFEAHIGGELSIGHKTGQSGADSANGSLTLGSRSTLYVGTSTALAVVNIGTKGSGSGNATGLLDATQGNAYLYLTELNVGRKSGSGGTATGTLKWNQSVALHADEVYFGRGKGTGYLDVPTGGTFLLGTATDPVSRLAISYNDTTGIGASNADLDFTVTDPTFEAYIGGDLSIGRVAGWSMSATANGSLTLGGNSTLHVGTATAPTAVVNIGMYEYFYVGHGTAGSATGLLDATQGTADFHLSDLYVGYGNDLWGGSTAKGTLITGSGSTIATTSANVGMGTSTTGIVNMNGGLLSIGNDLWIGRKTGSGMDATDGSLTLGSGSTLNVGTTTSPAVVNIGINQTGNGDATGLLDATQGTAYLYLTELNVGRKSSSGGTATGTLKWNQSAALHADEVYFGRGKGTGKLYVPTGGTFLLGTATDPVSLLAISYNDTTGVGASNADLDFTVTDPTFEAYIGGDLSIGHVTGWSMSATANGSLTLGGNSTLHVGTAAAPAVVNIGMYEYSNIGSSTPGTAIGLLDATQGTADFHLSELNVGYGEKLWAGATATGTLKTGSGTTISATTINVGTDTNATGTLTAGPGSVTTATAVNVGVGTNVTGTLTTATGSEIRATTVNVGKGTNATGSANLMGGLFVAETVNMGAGGAFNFTNGRLGIGTFNTYNGIGSLDQQGGTLAPGFSFFDTSLAGIATINGNYNLSTNGTLEIELFGLTPGIDYDQVFVNGLVDLNADLGLGGSLDVILGFDPVIGDQFIILHNDGTDPIFNTFAGLSEGAIFSSSYLGTYYPFRISYVGNDGNDIVLTSIVPVPGAGLLAGIGLLTSMWFCRRKTTNNKEH